MRERLVTDVETVGRESCKALVKPARNLRDPAKIAADLEEKWGKLALNPNFADIINLGILRMGDDPAKDIIVNTPCATDEDRADALRYFWDLWPLYQIEDTITFNGLWYDFPVIIRQSQLLGVRHPNINLSPYHSGHIDLYQRLTWNRQVDGLSLQSYCRLFGRPEETGEDGTGAEVAAWAAAGEWDKVTAHCTEDLRRTAWLARRISV